MYQLAIFDLDGTLVNSIADLGGTANRLLEQRGLPTHPLDAYYRFVGNGVHKLCRSAGTAAQRRGTHRRGIQQDPAFCGKDREALFR